MKQADIYIQNIHSKNDFRHTCAIWIYDSFECIYREIYKIYFHYAWNKIIVKSFHQLTCNNFLVYFNNSGIIGLKLSDILSDKHL